MPALPPATNVIRIQFEYLTASPLRAGNRLFYHYTGGPPSATNLNTLASDISTAFGTDLAGLMDVSYALTNVVCTDLTSSTAAEGSWSGSVSGTRGSSGGEETVNDCLLQVFTIDRRYRGGKPKTFWPFGLVTDRASPATWDGTLLSDAAGGWTAFNSALLALTGIGCTLDYHANVSFYSGFASVENPVTHRWRNIPTPRSPNAYVDVITGNAFKSEIGSQRRRRTSTVA